MENFIYEIRPFLFLLLGIAGIYQSLRGTEGAVLIFVISIVLIFGALYLVHVRLKHRGYFHK